MKSISELINCYLLKIFLVSSLVLVVVFFIGNKFALERSIENRAIKNEILLKSIGLTVKSGNEVARDMFLYEYAEENQLKGFTFTKNINDKKNCKKVNAISICISNKKNVTLYQKLKFNDEYLGYLKMDLGIMKTINLNYFYFILFLLGLNYFLTISGMSFFIKKPIEKNLKKLLSQISGEIVLDKNNIVEYNHVFEAYTQLLEKYNKTERIRVNQAIDVEKLSMSRQIAHDIRSPLEALKSVSNDMEGLDYTSKQIITNSIGRISDIANGLLKNTKENLEDKTTGNFRILIDDIINDKKFEHNIKIHYKTNIDYRDSFINGHENELYRSISNIVNNAYESQDPDQVRIEIELNKSSVGIELRIKDFGSGMSKEMIDKALFGGTTTKDKGNGLGVSFSKNTIEKHNGSFEIGSIEGKGTTVIIHLPVIETPNWFTDEITISTGSTEIVCVDDDPSFLELYKDKFKNVNKPIITYSEKTIDTARLLKGSQYYFDYDLGNNKTGLDYIIKNNLQSSSTLVTSMHQDEDIQSKCIDLGIRILPKQIFNNAKVIQNESALNENSDSNIVIFIDDDYLMHMSWKMEADKKGIELDCFHTIEEFLERADEYDKDTKIYIDSNLKDGIKGEVESEKIADLGFKELYLATGYSPSDIDKPKWIKEVVGKRASF